MGKADIWRRSAPSLLISRPIAIPLHARSRRNFVAMPAIAVARSVLQYADVGSGRCLVGHHRDGRDLGCRHLYRYMAAGIAASSVARPVIENVQAANSRTRAQIQRRAEIKRVVPCPFIPRRNLERFVGDLAGENLVCLVKFVPGIAHGIAPQVSRQPTSSNSTQLVERQRGPQILQSQRNRVEYVTFRHCLSALPPRADVRVACPTGP